MKCLRYYRVSWLGFWSVMQRKKRSLAGIQHTPCSEGWKAESETFSSKSPALVSLKGQTEDHPWRSGTE